MTLLLNRKLLSRTKLCLVSVVSDIVKDCPKMRNLPKIFLRSFENVAPGTCGLLVLNEYLWVVFFSEAQHHSSCVRVCDTSYSAIVQICVEIEIQAKKDTCPQCFRRVTDCHEALQCDECTTPVEATYLGLTTRRSRTRSSSVSHSTGSAEAGWRQFEHRSWRALGSTTWTSMLQA